MREVMSLGAFVTMLLCLAVFVVSLKPDVIRTVHAPEHTGVLQYQAFECAKMRLERFSGGAGAAAIGNTARASRAAYYGTPALMLAPGPSRLSGSISGGVAP